MFQKNSALVADSDKHGAQTVARFLKDSLHFGSVLTATNGQEAHEYVKSEKIEWIISDLTLPVMSGVDLLKAVRKNVANTYTPFIMLSATTDRESLIEAVNAGVSDYVAKPFTQATLKEKIERLRILQEKRVAPRVSPKGTYPGKLIFAPEIAFMGDVVNISTTGILLRSGVLKGAMIYDRADIELTLDAGVTVDAVVQLMRVEAEQGHNYPEGEYTLAGYHFVNLSDEAKLAISQFVNHHRVKELQRKTAR